MLPVHLRRRAVDGRDRAPRTLPAHPIPSSRQGRRDQQATDRAVPRRLAPADHVRDGTPDGHGRPPARPRSRRAPGAQPDRIGRVPVSERLGAAVRRGELPRVARAVRDGARSRYVARTAGRRAARRATDGPRVLLFLGTDRVRDAGVRVAEDGGHAGVRERAPAHGCVRGRDGSRRHPVPRPGARDHVRADRGGRARPAPGRRPGGAGRHRCDPVRMGDLREPFDRDRRRGRPTGRRDAGRTARADRRAPARGRARRRRARRGVDLGARRARSVGRDRRRRPCRAPRGPPAPGRDRTRARGPFDLRSAGHVLERGPRRRGRGRSRDRGGRDPSVRRRRGLWVGDQPHDRRGAGARRRGAGDRGGAVRAARLRRPGPTTFGYVRRLPGPHGRRDPAHRDRSPGDALHAFGDGGQGDGGGRHDRRPGGIANAVSDALAHLVSRSTRSRLRRSGCSARSASDARSPTWGTRHDRTTARHPHGQRHRAHGGGRAPPHLLDVCATTLGTRDARRV